MSAYLDRVVLVNEDDQVRGAMDKSQAHRESRLHRAVSVFLFRRTDASEVELLIQKRSSQKIVGAKQWANTICGNVRPGEKYEECAVRRLREELGMHFRDQKLQQVVKFQYQAQCNDEFSEHEIDQVFCGWWDGEIIEPVAEEVAEYERQAWSTLGDTFDADEKDWAVWFGIMMHRKDVVDSINAFIERAI